MQTPKLQIISALRWMLGSMVAMIILAACSQSQPSTGGAILSDKMAMAMDIVPERYTVMPIEIVREPANSALGFDGIFRIRQSYIDQSSIIFLACAIVHETVHVDQGVRPANQADELEAIAVQIDCLKEIGGSSSEIQHLENQDGLHYINQNYRERARGL